MNSNNLRKINQNTLSTNFIGHTGSVNTIAKLNSANLASGSSDSSIKIWNIEDGALLCTLEEHTAKVTKILVLPDGRLASASCDVKLILINFKKLFLFYSFYIYTYVCLIEYDKNMGFEY